MVDVAADQFIKYFFLLKEDKKKFLNKNGHFKKNRISAKIKVIKREYWAKFTSDMDYDLYEAQKAQRESCLRTGKIK